MLGKERISKLVDLYDEHVKLNAIVDAIDGFALKAILGYVNEKVLTPWADKNLSAENQGLILELIDAALEQDWNAIELIVENFANNKIDIPNVDEEAEKELIQGIFAVVKSFVKNVSGK